MEIVEILKFVLPSMVMLVAVYFLVAKFLEEERARMQTQFKHNILLENQKVSLPLRLQAYERLTLLMERMHPNQLVNRVRESGMTVGTFREALVKAVKSEYDYNLSQQIYVSNDVWKLTTQIKDQVIHLIHQIAEQLPQDAPALELAKAIFNYTIEVEEGQFPTEVGIKYLKNEVAALL
jgi:hypothetical protein